MICFRDYYFWKHIAIGSKVRWFCSQHRFGCKANLYTLENELIKYNGIHNH